MKNEDYNIIIKSDPQYPWTDITDAGGHETSPIQQRRSKELIRDQYTSINEYNGQRVNPGSIIINGDGLNI